MQDDTVVPLRCIVDISDLYKEYCSEYAMIAVSEYLGGLNKLIELSCHFATLELNHHQISYAHTLSKYTGSTILDDRTTRMITNTVSGLVKVLKPNFILMLTRPHTLPYLNHIQVLDARINKPTTLYSDTPMETVLTLSTMVYWTIGTRHGIC